MESIISTQPASPAAFDALSPEALRVEVALIIAGQYRTVSTSRQKAEDTADLVIAELLRFYAAAATPEVTEDAQATYSTLHALAHAADRAITAGAAMSQPLAEQDHTRKAWLAAAMELRETTQKVLGLLA